MFYADRFTVARFGGPFQTGRFTGVRIGPPPIPTAPAFTLGPAVEATNGSVGATLTCASTFTGYPTPTATLQWQRGASNVGNGSSDQTASVAGDFRCGVTLDNGVGPPVTVWSNVVAISAVAGYAIQELSATPSPAGNDLFIQATLTPLDGTGDIHLYMTAAGAGQPTNAQFREGTGDPVFHTKLQNVSVSTQIPGPTSLVAGTDYDLWAMYEPNETELTDRDVQMISFTQSAADGDAPILGSPSGSAHGFFGINDISFTANEPGTGWVYASASAAQPTEADHKSGNGALTGGWSSATMTQAGTVLFADMIDMGAAPSYLHFAFADPSGNFAQMAPYGPITPSDLVPPAVSSVMWSTPIVGGATCTFNFSKQAGVVDIIMQKDDPETNKPTRTQIEAGQDHTGATTPSLLNQAITTSGPQSFVVSGGEGLERYYFVVHAKDTSTPPNGSNIAYSPTSFEALDDSIYIQIGADDGLKDGSQTNLTYLEGTTNHDNALTATTYAPDGLAGVNQQVLWYPIPSSSFVLDTTAPTEVVMKLKAPDLAFWNRVRLGNFTPGGTINAGGTMMVNWPGNGGMPTIHSQAEVWEGSAGRPYPVTVADLGDGWATIKMVVDASDNGTGSPWGDAKGQFYMNWAHASGGSQILNDQVPDFTDNAETGYVLKFGGLIGRRITP